MKYLYKILIVISTVSSFPKFVSGRDTAAHDHKEYVIESEYEYYSDIYQYDDDDNEDYLEELPDECISIKSVKLKRICTSVYPEEVKETYMEKFVKTNDPYSVFQFPGGDTNSYFLTFHYSPLLHCKQIEVIDFKNFECTDESGYQRDIKVGSGVIKCLNHPSEMVDDLLLDCSSTNLESSVFSALHYAQLFAAERRSGCNALALSLRLQLASVLLVIVCVYRHCATFYTKFKVS